LRHSNRGHVEVPWPCRATGRSKATTFRSRGRLGVHSASARRGAGGARRPRLLIAPEDLAALRRDLVHARRVKIIEIPGATHFVLLDRPEHDRDRLIALLRSFLASGR